jgi:cardiolipin synthase
MPAWVPEPTAWQATVLLAAAAAFLSFRAVFGRRKHRRLAADRRRLRALSGSPLADGRATANRVTCLLDRDGIEAHNALVAGIRGARRRISIGTYILAHDAVGRSLVRLLAERARQGVEVRVLVDAVGSRFLPWTAGALLRRAGARLVRFNPFLTLRGRGSANWRNHRKIAVFDGTTALVGGQNLGGRYIGSNPSRRRFRDASFLIEGPAAAALEREREHQLSDPLAFFPCTALMNAGRLLLGAWQRGRHRLQALQHGRLEVHTDASPAKNESTRRRPHGSRH